MQMDQIQLDQSCHSRHSSRVRVVRLLLTKPIVFKRNKKLVKCWVTITATDLFAMKSNVRHQSVRVVLEHFVLKDQQCHSVMLLMERFMETEPRVQRDSVMFHPLVHVVSMKHVR
jgi:hypothetical protein